MVIVSVVVVMVMMMSAEARGVIEVTGLRAEAEYWIRERWEEEERCEEIEKLNKRIEALDERSVDLRKYRAERYGVTVKRGDLRVRPVRWSGDLYDENQGSAIDPCEAVAILRSSTDGEWVLVQGRSYGGWLRKEEVVECERERFLRYVAPEEYVVVTENLRREEIGGKEIYFQMGARIPLRIEGGRWKIRVAQKGESGEIAEVEKEVGPEGLNRGYLACTANNFIRQAFKFLGDEYGWGGLGLSVDCSALVQNVYRTMGINIPRDADQQYKCLPAWPGDVRSAPAGSLIFKPTHVMMKLGNDERGEPIVIHAASSYIEGGRKIYIRKVVVSEYSAVSDNVIGIGYFR